MHVGRVAFFHELKHSFDMPKSTLNAPTMRTHAFKQEIQTVAGRWTLLRPESLAALLLMITMALIVVLHRFQFSRIIDASLYPRDDRRPFIELDENRYPGAGVLMCFTEFGTLERAAAAWLIGSPHLVVLNAHNFVDRKLVPTRSVTDCFFRIKGADYYFEADSLWIGTSVGSKSLHITDDWALLRLMQPVAQDVKLQPVPDASFVATGAEMRAVMVSPAGHSNSRLESTVEECMIHTIDEPTEARARKARHDCNDGYGGSGSGLFTEDARLIAMRSASLDMNAKRPFDIETHYGSALLFEGELLEVIKSDVQKKP